MKKLIIVLTMFLLCVPHTNFAQVAFKEQKSLNDKFNKIYELLCKMEDTENYVDPVFLDKLNRTGIPLVKSEFETNLEFQSRAIQEQLNIQAELSQYNIGQISTLDKYCDSLLFLVNDLFFKVINKHVFIKVNYDADRELLDIQIIPTIPPYLEINDIHRTLHISREKAKTLVPFIRDNPHEPCIANLKYSFDSNSQPVAEILEFILTDPNTGDIYTLPGGIVSRFRNFMFLGNGKMFETKMQIDNAVLSEDGKVLATKFVDKFKYSEIVVLDWNSGDTLYYLKPVDPGIKLLGFSKSCGTIVLTNVNWKGYGGTVAWLLKSNSFRTLPDYQGYYSCSKDGRVVNYLTNINNINKPNAVQVDLESFEVKNFYVINWSNTSFLPNNRYVIGGNEYNSDAVIVKIDQEEDRPSGIPGFVTGWGSYPKDFFLLSLNLARCIGTSQYYPISPAITYRYLKYEGYFSGLIKSFGYNGASLQGIYDGLNHNLLIGSKEYENLELSANERTVIKIDFNRYQLNKGTIEIDNIYNWNLLSRYYNKFYFYQKPFFLDEKTSEFFGYSSKPVIVYDINKNGIGEVLYQNQNNRFLIHEHDTGINLLDIPCLTSNIITNPIISEDGKYDIQVIEFSSSDNQAVIACHLIYFENQDNIIRVVDLSLDKGTVGIIKDFDNDGIDEYITNLNPESLRGGKFSGKNIKVMHWLEGKFIDVTKNYNQILNKKK